MEKGFYYRRWGGPEELRFGTLPENKSIDPNRIKLNSGEILVQVRTISVNPIDWKILSGSQRPVTLPRFPRIFGTDFSGTVYRAGEKAEKKGFSKGRRVMGLVSPLNNGSGRQWLKVRADHCLIIPENLSFEEGSALPEACISALLVTSFSNRKRPGKVLLFGASGGVGSIALQILAFRGWDVTAVCRKNQRRALKELGCRDLIDRFNWEEELSRRSCWDAVVDCPAAIIKKNPIKFLKRGGVYSPVYIPDAFIPFQIIRTILWFFSSRRTGFFLGYPSAGRMKRIQRLLEIEKIRPLIASSGQPEDLSETVRLSKAGGGLGKRILFLSIFL